MNVAIIGIGLIGGSIAKDLRNSNYAIQIIGVDSNEEHAKIALKNNLVDRIFPLISAVNAADIIILATPVEISKIVLIEILNVIDDKIVIDVCSTKKSLSDLVVNHACRGRYVAAHPMAGTEYSGPNAAVLGLFENKTNIICDKELCDEDALNEALNFFEVLKMKTSFMASDEHDIHAANVSHLSHISSFSLALSVLEIEKKNTDEIKRMAAGGFRSTVRLAKSDARTWEEILLDNSGNVLYALEIYITQLNEFKKALKNKDKIQLNKLIKGSNKIGPIVDSISKTPEEI